MGWGGFTFKTERKASCLTRGTLPFLIKHQVFQPLSHPPISTNNLTSPLDGTQKQASQIFARQLSLSCLKRMLSSMINLRAGLGESFRLPRRLARAVTCVIIMKLILKTSSLANDSALPYICRG